MKAIKNPSGDFDIVDVDGNTIGEVSVLHNWTGESLFEQVSRHKLDFGDMGRIMELMKACAMYPDKGEIE